MALFRGWLGKRIGRIDQARIDLFELDEDEFAVEGQALTMFSLWPTLMGLPFRPEDAANLPPFTLLADTEMRLPLMGVGLLTSKNFRWSPISGYRGRAVFREPIHSYLADADELLGRGVYSQFGSPLLRGRAIPIGHIKRVTLDAFEPGDVAFMSIHLVDDFSLAPDLPWPRYVITPRNDPEASVGLWGMESPDQPHLMCYMEGSSSATAAGGWANGFDYLEIPFQTEYLDDESQASWNRWREMEPRERWRTMNQRLRQE